MYKMDSILTNEVDEIKVEKSFLIGIKSLQLGSFRNHERLSLEIETGLIALVGSNGTGKTSVLEAISNISPGKSLRGANFQEMVNINYDNFLINIKISEYDNLESNITIGFDKIQNKKKFLLDDKDISRTKILKNSIALLWMTPAMERIFNQAPSARRQFIDRIVLAFDFNHISRISGYDKILKERSKVLKESPNESEWLDSIEESLANYAVVIASSRLDVIERLREFLDSSLFSFPSAKIKFNSSVENMLTLSPAIEVEERLKASWKKNRSIDVITGGSTLGIHRSDIDVLNEYDLPASMCSSGEQKAILTSIILAASRSLVKYKGKPPILLLDEVYSHLDSERRASLSNELIELKMQAWMTGTEKEQFSNFNKNYDVFILEKN